MEQKLIDANALEERFSWNCAGECGCCSYNNSLCDIITEAPAVDAIPLPDNATNGDIIKALFNCEVCEPIIEDDIIHVIFADKNDSAIGFDWSWWNAPYRKEQNNDPFTQAVSDSLLDFSKQIIENYEKEQNND